MVQSCKNRNMSVETNQTEVLQREMPLPSRESHNNSLAKMAMRTSLLLSIAKCLTQVLELEKPELAHKIQPSKDTFQSD